VPAGWTAAGPKPMRLASFDIPDAAGNGDVSISKLNGDGGGLLANVEPLAGSGRIARPGGRGPGLELQDARPRPVETRPPGSSWRALTRPSSGPSWPGASASWFFKLTVPSPAGRSAARGLRTVRAIVALLSLGPQVFRKDRRANSHKLVQCRTIGPASIPCP
jgi:hypothetical protein